MNSSPLHIILLIFTFLFFSIKGKAQYEGGEASGYNTLAFNNPANICGVFLGSTGSGFSTDSSPEIECFGFSGGDFSGQDNSKFINTESFCYQYEGDSSSGYADNFSPTIECFSFTGGAYSGQDESRFINTESFCYQYEGDSSSGYADNFSPTIECFSFAGGHYSGQDDSRYINHNAFCFQYEGDTSSGFSTNHSPTIECLMFAGGDYSGQNENRFKNPHSCVQFMASSSGGSGHSFVYGECLEVIALPIESSPLFGEVIDRKGSLYWTTYSERDNMGFDIEKTSDGYNWEVIGWVDGQGNSTSTIQYEFVDENLSVEGQYYRFKQIDYDGAYAYSNIVFLNYENKENLKDMFVLYPNPSRKGEVIKLRSWASQDIDATILIADGAGRVIHNEKFVFSSGMETFYFPVDKLSPGTYHLSLRSIKHPEGVRIPFVIF